MINRDLRISRLKQVVNTTFEIEVKLRLELLAEAESAGDWEVSALEHHDLLSLYQHHEQPDRAHDVYQSLLKSPAINHAIFWIFAESLYRAKLYEDAIDAVNRGINREVERLQSKRFGLVNPATRIIHFYTLELMIRVEMLPLDVVRVEHLLCTLSYSVTLRTMTVLQLTDAVIKVGPRLNSNRYLKNLARGLNADLEMARNLPDFEGVAIDKKIENIKRLYQQPCE